MAIVQDRAENGRTELEQTEGAGTWLTHELTLMFGERS